MQNSFLNDDFTKVFAAEQQLPALSTCVMRSHLCVNDGHRDDKDDDSTGCQTCIHPAVIVRDAVHTVKKFLRALNIQATDGGLLRIGIDGGGQSVNI